MNKRRLACLSLVFLNLFLMSHFSFASEVDVSSRIDVAEFDAKYVKSSWCIFSDGDSSTGNKTLSASLSGENNRYTQRYNRRGKTYLSREIYWDSQTTNKKFTLSFHADDANFSDSDEYEDRTCSYRYWKAHSSSAQTKLNARAAFKIPNNVWAIRITSVTEALGANTQLKLSHNDYVDNENGESTLKKTNFYAFEGDSNNRYFLTNASTSEQDNFVYLDVTYVKNTLTSSDFSLNFQVDFISAEECFNDLVGKTYVDLIHANFNKKNIDDALVNMACMLNPKYIKHSLSTVYLYDLRDFFSQINKLEEKVDLMVGAAPAEHDLAAYKVLLTLIDRVRFYYAYEILKETMNLLNHKISYHGETIDSLFYIEVLRRRGIISFFKIFNNLIKDLEGLSASPDSPFITIESNIFDKFGQLNRAFLPHEIKVFKNNHDLIYSPKYLSLNAYADFKASAKLVTTSSQLFISDVNQILHTPVISSAQAERLKTSLRNAIDKLRLYVIAFDQFQGQIGGDEMNVHDSRRRLLVQLDYVFQINLQALLSHVGEYFSRHFEDPVFEHVVVGDTHYNDVNSFIADFEALMQEALQ
jgi:hypothetical protein